MTDDPEELLGFWFGPAGAPQAYRAWWFERSEATDEELRHRFLPLWEAAARGERDGWATSPRGRLALLLALDQLSRNLWRGSPRAFSQDARAQRLALEGLAAGQDRALSFHERSFFYLPLMHAEDRGLQARSVRLYERLANEAPEAERGGAARSLDFARRHRDIVERFGRFPHRDAALGRPITAEEAAFLLHPGSSF